MLRFPSPGHFICQVSRCMNTSQQKSIAKLARRISLTMLRFSSICVGSWLTAVVPVEVWADGRRIANAAADYMPNMDPGTVVVIAFFLTLPVLAVVLLIESMRWWACGHEPLTFSSCVTLGALAACPIGYSFAVAEVPLEYPFVFFASTLSVGVFYMTRSAWLQNHAKRTWRSWK